MNVTQELMREHQMILQINDQMRTLANPANTLKQEAFLAFVGRYVDFIERFVDDYHHTKEEEILFEALNIPDILQHCNPVSQMLLEHEQAREALNLIKEGLSQRSASLAQHGIERYAKILEQHIFKEDNVLYPMAEKGFSDDLKSRINQYYSEVEGNKNKRQLWQECAKFCNDLQSLQSDVVLIKV